MKRYTDDWDREKKLKRVEKGTNKEYKHRKSIYNMMSEGEDYYDGSDIDEYSDEDNYDRNTRK